MRFTWFFAACCVLLVINFLPTSNAGPAPGVTGHNSAEAIKEEIFLQRHRRACISPGLQCTHNDDCCNRVCYCAHNYCHCC